jgi:hypothetical protein
LQAGNNLLAFLYVVYFIIWDLLYATNAAHVFGPPAHPADIGVKRGIKIAPAVASAIVIGLAFYLIAPYYKLDKIVR